MSRLRQDPRIVKALEVVIKWSSKRSASCRRYFCLWRLPNVGRRLH